MEGDITACFDEISHTTLMDRVRSRIGDKRMLLLVKAFLKSEIMSRDGAFTDTRTGTPQGGILSPLPANIALSALDEHIAQAPGGPGSTSGERRKRRRRGMPNYRLVRYADDFLVLVSGSHDHAAVAERDAKAGTQRIQHRSGCAQYAAVGPGLTHAHWLGTVIRWIRRKHPGITWKQHRRRYCDGGWWPATEDGELFNPAKVSTTRYRYRGTVIPSPWLTAA
ncbi:reverse transcriptase/maturase family protein [Streptomyces sp. NPDC057565]|uniref:reverse transcriptase/maturase family protein n=1 Tax=Streptomyces sp. NPDC057565 TaxID=3346169 RepID=UPI0036839400